LNIRPIAFSIKPLPRLGEKLFNEWGLLDYIVGGNPILIYEHTKMVPEDPKERLPLFLAHRQARTAVGVLPNGNWVFIVVDKLGLFDGMTLYELAGVMEQLGCIYALNLNGGGASAMTYRGGIINTPHGEGDANIIRKVSDAILVMPKK
jgi:hypothetical protein